MGNSKSVIIPQYGADFSSSINTPNDGFSKIKDNTSNSLITTNRSPNHFDSTAIWSVRSISGPKPSPRLGHAWVYSEEDDVAVIAYGFDNQKTPLNDFWKLYLSSNHWEPLNIVGGEIPFARAGCKAVLAGKNMIIFGGYAKNKHLDNLHFVNIETGQITYPRTTGDPPTACSGFVMSYINNQVIVFGGYNGSALNQLSILNLSNLEWKTVQTVHQRTAPGYCTLGSSAYVYGGGKVQGVISISYLNSPSEGEISPEMAKILPNGGSIIPPCDITAPNLVGIADRFLLLVGGDRKSPVPTEETTKYTPIYAFDLMTNRWCIFHVFPDAITTNFSDGFIDKNGEFLLPNSKESTIFYRKKEREVVAMLGQPQYSPPVMFVFACGESIAVLNHQDDMINALISFST
ncbi:Kelch motif family protein [Tritrichomonas foetus]|uniref:Kelch motif family protein n=1 Tax=Tritrichomonas foetus TaxID=1144522 RepID=A0A1J4KHP1_9EUKA|nr:Kelch motif family protein [Tritrichomonas foetus]|eukprot:OHT10715.1 Kelch motif family protein [Tritrichomonas foetus]